MSGHWIAVASAAHVRRGRALGFMQVCHGRLAPLRRVRPGDRVAYYSPTVTFRGKDMLRAFTAIGTVGEGEPYRVDCEGMRAWRRDVDWVAAREAPIRPLLEALELTAGKANWGYAFRFGLVPVSAHDFRAIAAAMAAPLYRNPIDRKGTAATMTSPSSSAAR
jgi:hypothetical protein